MEKILFTSESVTEGHPDKVCDSISDAILDAMMAQDPMSRVACETATTTGLVLVMGEITTKANVISRRSFVILSVRSDMTMRIMALTQIPVRLSHHLTSSPQISLWVLTRLLSRKRTI